MYDGPIIDVDVHHRWSSEAELFEYLDPEWLPVVERPRSQVFVDAPVAQFIHLTGSVHRTGVSPENGPPGAPPDYATFCRQYLDPFPVERVVLSFDIGTSGGVPNAMLATALCRAANDWSVNHWIDRHRDERLYTAALVPTQVAADGAAEVRRMAAHPRVVEALMVSNGNGRPFGHPAYHAIYEAAAEAGLPIAIHSGADQWINGAQANAGGLPNGRFEFHTLVPHSMQAHLLSFITYGVFEKYPGLKLMIVEVGVSWLPWLMWSMDKYADELRSESPWVRRRPSDYVREHVRVSTQPIEVSPKRTQLMDAMSAPGGIEDVLCFSSDYPHWDTDDPRYIARRLPAEWSEKLFYENAAAALRFPDSNSSSAPLAAVDADR